METKISNGNSKVGKIPNVSLTPIKSCGNCEHCKSKCYALKSYRMYKNVRHAWENNYNPATEDSAKYFAGISEYIAKKNPHFFRWHVSGDILNQNYLKEMIKIAESFPETRFLAFTKMHNLIFPEIPKNMTIVFSMFPGMPDIENPNNFPIAWCQDGTEKRYNKKDTVNCPGRCDTCGMCWELPKLNKNVVFNIH